MKLRRTYRLFSLAQRLGVGVLVIAMLWLSPALAYAQSEPLTIPADQQAQDDVTTTGRDIVVEGEVLGDVTSWSGTITILGHVHGDVVSYSGAIELAPTARVDGHVLALAGGVTHMPGAQVAGQLIGNEPISSGAVASLIQLFGESQPGAGSLAGKAVLSSTFAVLALLLATASAWRWPRRTEGASRTLRFMPWRSLTVGLLTTLLLAVLLLPLATLLAVTLVGLPLILALLLLLQLPYIYGLATVAQLVGRGVLCLSRPGAAERATALGAALLLAPITAVGVVTLTWSALLFYLLASAGLGAAILSRGGVFAPVAREA